MFQGVVFKVEIKNLALSDSKGHDLEKEVVVRVTSLESKQVRGTPRLQTVRLPLCLRSDP